jgi:tetraacyldisaccharide 4'-kinase
VFLASLLTQMGKAVVVGCSGYGSPGSERATIAPEGNIKAARWGDEAALFRYLLPDAPLIVGRDRVLAAKLCHETFPDSILLMDDGFQHLPLQKDISIILDPVPSNPRCIPAGPYRERPSKHHPIDALIPGKFWVVTSPLSLLDPRENIEVALPEEANLLCAIGTPQNFAKAVSEAGVRLKIARFLKDHSPLTNGNLFEGLSPDLPLIVTVKDWVKLRDREDIGSLRVLVARYEVSAEPAPDFATWLQQKLDEVVSKGT